MGECGPTATEAARVLKRLKFSRWGNAGQPQQRAERTDAGGSLADGGMRANRNSALHGVSCATSLADGGMRANRNNRTFRMPRDRV